MTLLNAVMPTATIDAKTFENQNEKIELRRMNELPKGFAEENERIKERLRKLRDELVAANLNEDAHGAKETKMNAKRMRSLIEALEKVLDGDKVLDEIVVFNPETNEAHRIDEGKWIPTKTTNTIRIDQPMHGVGQTHAHIYGRKENQIGVVNLDGTASHNSRMRLSKKDADTLRSHGFAIRPDRIVEWIIRPELKRVLLLD